MSTLRSFIVVAVQAVHVSQALLSGFCLHHAYHSIINLQKYEDKTKKAAEYSRTAGDQLHKTRTTQASGTIAALLSLASSLYLLLGTPASVKVNGYTSLIRTTQFQLAAFNVITSTAARLYMDNFWKNSAKVPGVTGYNDAISHTNTILWTLRQLSKAWLVSCAIFPY